jgi:hypothetical protein
MRQHIKAFADDVRANTPASAVFYYSGHGMQVNGVNYMIPVDAEIADQDDVEQYSVRLDEVLLRLKSSQSSPTVAILDACRNNPFEKRYKSAPDGLAKPNLWPASIVAFAAAPGAVAPQASGGALSPYTAVLVERLDTNAPAVVVLQQVANDVYAKSAQRQSPYVETSAGLDATFSFGGTMASGTTTLPPRAVPNLADTYRIKIPNNGIFSGGTITMRLRASKLVFSELNFSLDADYIAKNRPNLHKMLRNGDSYGFAIKLSIPGDKTIDGKDCCWSVKEGKEISGGRSDDDIALDLPPNFTVADLLDAYLVFEIYEDTIIFDGVAGREKFLVSDLIKRKN